MKVLGWVIHWVGFIMYAVFLSLAKNISTEAWWYAAGASFGVLLFCTSRYFRDFEK